MIDPVIRKSQVFTGKQSDMRPRTAGGALRECGGLNAASRN